MRKDVKKLVPFSVDIEALVEYLQKYWDGCDKVKPKGYDEFVKDYEDYQGMTELDTKSLCNEFKGMDNATASSFPFPIQVSLPHVAYDDLCQGRNPFHMLVSACVSYGMMRGVIYAKEELKKDLKLPLSSIKRDVDYINEILERMRL